MSVNVERLQAGLAAVEAAAERGEWEQNTWRCETGMCFAGWVVTLNGGRWLHPAGNFGAFKVAPEDIDATDHVLTDDIGQRWVWPADRACRLLGLDTWDTDLFSPDNTLDDLRRIVAELIATAEPVGAS
jgi:hypothetical protein